MSVCALSSWGEEGVCQLLKPLWGENNAELWGTSLGLGARNLAMVLRHIDFVSYLEKRSEFPVAAVTSPHTLYGLKPHTCLIPQFRRSEA